MPKRLNIDYGKLLKMVNSAMPQKEIMNEFGIKTVPQFKNAYLNALIDAGQVKKPAGNKSGKGTKISRDVTVNNRNSLTISNALMADLGYKPGDKFSVRRSRAGLSLKRV